jgi:hypothetical protein
MYHAHILTTVLLAVFISGCVGSSGVNREHITREQAQLKYRPELHEIILADGIDKREADVIRTAYFMRFAPMKKGITSEVFDGGEYWFSTTAFGDTVIKHFLYTEMPMVETKEPIKINKKTGRVTWSEGPTIDDPRTIDD